MSNSAQILSSQEERVSTNSINILSDPVFSSYLWINLQACFSPYLCWKSIWISVYTSEAYNIWHMRSLMHRIIALSDDPVSLLNGRHWSRERRVRRGGGGNMCSAHLFGTVPFFRERACVILSCGDEAIHLSSIYMYVCTMYSQPIAVYFKASKM